MTIFYGPVPRSKKKRQTQRAREMQAENEALVRRLSKGVPVSKINLFVAGDSNGYSSIPLSNTIPGGVFPKRDIFTDHKWKRNCEETNETVSAIHEKASRVGLLYPKGAYQLAFKKDDYTTIGKRR